MSCDMEQRAIKVTYDIIYAFYCKRDIDEVLSYLDENVTWIGPGEREQKYSLEKIREYFMLGKDSVPSCEVSSPNFRAVPL